MHPGGDAGVALQRACVATLASLLRDTPALAAQLRGEALVEQQGQGQPQGQRQGGERGTEWPLSPEAFDAAAAQLPERFVLSQPAAARPFARLLCETSALRIYLEALLRPRHCWPRTLLAFERAAEQARERAA